MVLAAYNLLLTLLAPLLVPYLALRSRLKGRPWRRVLESFGAPPASLVQTRPGAVWLHAVSVGEALAAEPLVRRLRAAAPGRKIFVSTATPTGQAAAEEKLGALADGVFYAPFDFAWAVRATLRALRPAAVVVLETEIWPNLYRESKRAGASLLIVNGRISDRSTPRYRRFRWFFAPALERCDRILTQSEADARRFIEAGAPPEAVDVSGNLKYDFDPGAAEPAEELARALAKTRPEALLVAGSTRDGEEGPVAAAFAEVARAYPRALLIVAPRHPPRFDEAAAALAAAGLPVTRRSRLPEAPLPLPGILLLDSLGELSSLYPLAAAVFVGGSLNGWGGHNVLEPALAGRPVVVGPWMQNFRDIDERLTAAGALLRVESAEGLGRVWGELLADPARARAIGVQARRAAEAERGAADRAARAIADLAGEAGPVAPLGAWRRLAAFPLMALWAAGATLHERLYGWGLLRSRSLPRFTVCVGNLTAGGSGKTPVVLRLAERLSLHGLRPAVLTRGYRRRSREPVVVVEPFEAADPARVGDEAAVLAERLTLAGAEVAIGAGADRFRVGSELLQRFEADLFLLDDGFSRHRLARDFNLLLVDASRPLFEEPFLPLGRRRERLRTLERADAFLLTRTRPGLTYVSLVRRLHSHRPGAPVFRSRAKPLELRSADRVARRPIAVAEAAGRSAFAFCGLGNPTSFFATLEEIGLRLAGTLAFGDHHRYTLDDWWRIAAAARESGAELVVTTEKDIANLAPSAPLEMRTGSPPVYVLVIDAAIDDEQALLDLIESRREAWAGGNRA